MATQHDGLRPVMFTRAAHARVSAAVKTVENTPRASGGKPSRPGVSYLPIYRAVSTTAIGAGSFNTLGSGSVRVAVKNSYDGGSWSFLEEQTAYNQFDGDDIPENTALLVVPISGDLFIIAAGCDAEAAPIIPTEGG